MDTSQSIEKWLAAFEAAQIGGDVKGTFIESCRTLYRDFSAAGNSNMEVAQARGTYGTLKDRLDAADTVDNNTQADVAALKSNKADKTALQALASGSPAGTYSDIASIPADADTNRIYLITAGNLAGHWVYYNGSSWTDGGVYQAVEIANNSIANQHVATNAIWPWNCSFFADLPNLNDGVKLPGYIAADGTIKNENDARYTHSNFLPLNAGNSANGKTYTLVYPFYVQKMSNPSVLLYTEIDGTGTLATYTKDPNYPVFTIKVTGDYKYLRLTNSHPDFGGDYSSLFLLDGTYANADIIKNYDLDTRYGGDLKGKIIVMAGDSITTGWQPDDTYLTTPYPEQIAKMTGATVYNKGMGATKVTSITGHVDANRDFCQPARYRQFVYPVDGSTITPDFVTVMAGTNDHTLNAPLGRITDSTTDTFYGAYKTMVLGLLHLIRDDPTMQLRTKLCLITPSSKYCTIYPYGEYNQFWTKVRHVSDEQVMTKNALGYRMDDYVRAIKEIGRLYNVPVLDLWSSGGLTRTLLTDDGTHTRQTASDNWLAYTIAEWLKNGMVCDYTTLYDAVGTDSLKTNAVTPDKTTFLDRSQCNNLFAPDMLVSIGADVNGTVKATVPTTDAAVGTYYRSIIMSALVGQTYEIAVKNSNYKNQCRLVEFDDTPAVDSQGTIILDNPHLCYDDTLTVTYTATKPYVMLTIFEGTFAYDDTPDILIDATAAEYDLDGCVKISSTNLDGQVVRAGNCTFFRAANESLYDNTVIAGGIAQQTGADSIAVEGFGRTPYMAVNEGDVITVTDTSNKIAVSAAFYAFWYPSQGQGYQITDYERASDNAVYTMTVPAGIHYMRMLCVSPTYGDYHATLSIKRTTYTLASGRYAGRPDNGVVAFEVPINVILADTTSNTLAVQDNEETLTDHAILALPKNYDPDGKPTRLIIYCHGAGTHITADTTTLAAPAGNLIKLGYAVMDVNGIPDSMSDNTGLHYGAPIALQSYIKAYHWVIKRYNVTREVFVVGTSMGGLTSNMIVQSGSIPVIAQAGFCPVVDHFRQAFCLPWSNRDAQRNAISKLFGFVGDYTFNGSLTDLTKPEMTYYMDNIDKIIGYNPIMRGAVNWYDINPYSKLTIAAVADASWQQSIAEEKVIYDKLIIHHPVPIKIWHNDDDGTVRQRYSEYFVNAIRRGGGLAYLRRYPSGGHNAWDNGESVQMTDVDGNAITVTASTYELVQWLKRFE